MATRRKRKTETDESGDSKPSKPKLKRKAKLKARARSRATLKASTTPSATNPRGLGATSFTRVTAEVPRRIIGLITGQTNTGRTHLALTAPGPICYQGIEMGDEGVKEQFIEDKIIMSAHYIAKVVRNLDQTNDAEKKRAQAEASKLYAQLAKDYVDALHSADVRTIVWDTGSQLGELARVAAFGRLTKVLPRDWTDQKFEFQKLVQMAYAHNKNFLVIAKLGAVYENDKKTSMLEPKGMSDVLYLFPTIVRTYTEIEEGDDGEDARVHWFEVEKVKGDGAGHLLGKVYDPPNNQLKHLWADMFDRDPSEW